jgi:outer membrane protein assembly factor BamB
MGDESKADPAPSPAAVRVWPAVALAVIYWVFQFIVAQSDISVFPRFMSKTIASLAFLLLFIILWLSNGTLKGRTRLLGFALFIGALPLGIAVAHRSYDAVSFLMTTVPYVLTTWAAWLLLARRFGTTPVAGLAVAILAPIGAVDLLRWEGVDGRLVSTVSWRWSATPEQLFLTSKATAAPVERSTKPWTLRAGDWPEFRGTLRDGAARGVRIAGNWKESPPEQVWKQSVGPGWSSVIVVDGFLVTQEQRGEWEAVVCYEAGTGKEVWVRLDPARFSEGISGAGPRATPTFRDGRLYAFGANGLLLCLDAASGKLLWSRDVAREASAPIPQWGYSASPLVVDGKVIVFAGGAKSSAAFDAATGVPVWSREGGKDSYSSAHLVPIRGKPQIVMQDSKRMVGLAVADGAILWERANLTPSLIPMLQPHPLEDGSLLASSGQDLALLDLKEDAGAWKIAERWTSSRFRPNFDDFVVHEGHVYGLDDGILSCVDVKTGARVWKKGRYGSGQVLLIPDQGALIVLSEKGELALIDARPQEPGEEFRFQAIEGKTWNHPVLAQDRLYVRNSVEMACYRLRPVKTP